MQCTVIQVIIVQQKFFHTFDADFEAQYLKLGAKSSFLQIMCGFHLPSTLKLTNEIQK